MWPVTRLRQASSTPSTRLGSVLAGLALAGLLLATTAACAEDEPAAAPASRPLLTGDVSDDELDELVDGDTAFALDVYRALRVEDGNLVYSPYGLTELLSLIHAGSRGATTSQLEAVMRQSLPDGRVPEARDLLAQLIGANDGIVAQDTELYLRESVEVRPSFLALSETFWRTTPQTFRERSDLFTSLRVALPALGSDDRLLEQLVPGADPVALGFTSTSVESGFIAPFNAAATQPGPFTTRDASVVEAQFLSGDMQGDYADLGSWEAVRLTLESGLRLLIVVPDAGRFDEIERAFGADALERTRAALVPTDLNLRIPEVTVETGVTWNQALTELGASDLSVEPVGGRGADFTELATRPEVWFDNIASLTSMSITESGIGSSTSPGRSADLENPLPFTVDRPFVFLVEHESTGELVLMGRVVDPTR